MHLLKIAPFRWMSVSLFISFVVLSPQSLWAVDLLTTAASFADQAEDQRMGIEVEFSGISLEETLKIIQSVTGGSVRKTYRTIKTTLKEVGPQGMIFNEKKIPEWVLMTPSLGEIIVKIDTNQVDDDTVLTSDDEVIEIVTAPIRRAEVRILQKVLARLKASGAIGTSEGQPVSIQYNIEMNEGDVENLNWEVVVNLMKVYFSPKHQKQLEQLLKVPDFRKPYLNDYSPGFLARLMARRYQPDPRTLFDDYIYRQSLEFLGFKDAWTMTTEAARKKLLEQPNPIVPAVVKQNKLRISSLLVRAFPEDPMSRLYMDSGWLSPYPIIEWREFNNDFDVLTHSKEVLGLMYMVDEFGVFDHDQFMNRASGVATETIEKLRQQVFSKNYNQDNPITFRYFVKHSEFDHKEDYRDVQDAYKDHAVDFLPYNQYGYSPLIIPGESIVMHRNPFHRYNVLGKYNPTLINAFIMQALENKYVEIKFWNDFVHFGIPKTQLMSELGLRSISSTSRDQVLHEVEEIMAVLNKNYPSGWVIKGLYESMSEKEILSDLVDSVKAVKTYLYSDFDQYYQRVNRRFSGLMGPENVMLELKKHDGYRGWKILNLLKRLNTVMVQQRFKVNREFRVEVVAGQVLGGEAIVDKFKYTHSGELGSVSKAPAPATINEIKRVERFAKSLMAALPQELRGMTFGLDVALTKNGGAVLIESNPGGNSSYLYEEEPLAIEELNQFLKEYPKMVADGQIHQGMPPKAQLNFLRRKFQEWNLNVEEMYPQISFLKDRIEDKDFTQVHIPKVRTTETSARLSCQDAIH